MLHVAVTAQLGHVHASSDGLTCLLYLVFHKAGVEGVRRRSLLPSHREWHELLSLVFRFGGNETHPCEVVFWAGLVIGLAVLKSQELLDWRGASRDV